MIDRDGYRPNVGIVLCNSRNEVFWGKRVREHSWQFPQGGIKPGETPELAMYRELREEVGLNPEHVKILGRTRDWLRYDVPDQWIKRDWRGNYRGQKQIWFLLRLVGRDCDVCLRVYEKALSELSRYLRRRPDTPPPFRPRKQAPTELSRS